MLVTIERISRNSKPNADSELYARGLFEHSPVSLWVEEDFSSVKALLDDLRERGIVNFRTFTNVHPEFVEQCMQEIHVLDVNQHTLRMFGAPDKVTLLARLPDHLPRRHAAALSGATGRAMGEQTLPPARSVELFARWK